MRILLALMFVSLAAATIVAAVAFRSNRAKGGLRLILRVAYLYILVLILGAAYRVYQQGGIW